MKKMETEEKKNPKERIVDTATDLIYRNGFDATSVNDLIQASGTHKASFYRYFQNKEEVGDLYLVKQGQSFLFGWKSLMEKSKSREQFVSIWVSLLKRQIRKDAFFGCPIARFMASSEKSLESPRIAKEMIDSWIDALASFLLSFEPNGLEASDFEKKKTFWTEISKQCIKIFQANSQLFIITHEISYISEMESEMLALLK